MVKHSIFFTSWVIIICSLFQMGCAKGVNISPIRSDLRSDDENVRWRGLLKVAVIGPDCKELEPDIIDMLDEGNWRLRQSAILALSSIEHSDKAIPRIAEMLNDESEWVRFAAVEDLKRLGNKAVATLGSLRILASEDESEFVREAAEEAINVIDGNIS